MTKPFCIGCKKTPEELDEYISAAEDMDMNVDEFVRREEGTYNPDNGHFLCTPCYIQAGCPTSPQGWKAP